MTHELAIPATIREQFEALIPYVVDFRRYYLGDNLLGWALYLRVPEHMISGTFDEAFLKGHNLTLEIGQDEFEVYREYITPPRRDYEIVLKYNA